MNQTRLARRLVLPILLVLVSILLIQAARVLVVVKRLETDVAALQSMTDPGSLFNAAPGSAIEAPAAIAAAARDMRDLRSTLGVSVYALPVLSWFPRYGGELANAPALIEFGAEVSTGAEETFAIAESLDKAAESGSASQSLIGLRLLYAAQAQQPAILQAREHLVRAEDARNGIDIARLGASRREMIGVLDRWLPIVKSGLSLLTDATDLFGVERSRTYLLIAQNSDELRATGGFISGVAPLHVERGEIAVGEFKDSLVVDDVTKPHPNPPEPLSRYMFAGQWLFRDANWSPDWPTAARQIEQLYQIDHDKVDGVVAVNLRLVPRLLQAIGPVDLDGSGEHVDATNVVLKIQTYWNFPQAESRGADWWSHRKDFLGQLLQAILRRLISGSFDRSRLVGALADAMTSKDLSFYVNSGEIAPRGSLYAGAGDALMLVDSNVGFNKVDNNIARRVGYTVALDRSGAARASIVITYTNTSPDIGTFCIQHPLYQSSYSDLQQGCYWNYVRVAVPAGAQLVRAAGVWNAKTEEISPGRIAFGGYFVLPRGQTSTVRFDYRLPALLDESHYALYWEMQPGAPSIPVQVSIVLPNGFSAWSDSPFRFSDDALELDLLLDRDQRINVETSSSSAFDPLMVGVAASAIVLVPTIVYVLARRRRAE